MASINALSTLTGFIDFAIRSSCAFLVSWMICKLISQPGRRFFVWSSFLMGIVGYWLWSVTTLLKNVKTRIETTSAPDTVTGLGSTVAIPEDWISGVALALQVLACAYMAGLAYFLISYVRRYLHLRWVLRFSWAAPLEIQQIFLELTSEVRLSKCNLLMLDGIQSPATIGWPTPVVLLPASCVGSDPAELTDIIRHELQHIRRRDFLYGVIAHIAAALVFFHPAAWFAKRRLEMEREYACDLAVLSQSPERRLEYAECLVMFARLAQQSRTRSWGIDFASSPSHLKERVERILRIPKEQPRWQTCVRATAIALLAAIFVFAQPTFALFFITARSEILESTNQSTSFTAPNRARSSPPLKNGRRSPAYQVKRYALPLDATPSTVDEASLPMASLPDETSFRRDPTPLVLADSSTNGTIGVVNARASEPLKQARKKKGSVMSHATSVLFKAGMAAGGYVVANGIAEAIEHAH